MGVKEIKLSQNKVAIVDAEDFAYLNQWKWWCSKGAAIRSKQTNGLVEYFYMHRVLMNPPEDMEIDHINNNPLDNRKCNLRICTHRENLLNRLKKKAGKSKYKGLYWDKRRNKWIAQIAGKVSGHLYLGQFDKEEDAAAAYNAAALKYHGEYGKLNNVGG